MPSIALPPFRVDLDSEQLWHGTKPIALRPKTWAVLRYFIEHPGRLVRKQDLLDAVWPSTAISEATLTSSIRELRVAFGDAARRPRYIETVHRRGFRFIAAIPGLLQEAVPPDTTDGEPSAAAFVGRAAELQQLDRRLERMLRGERQVVFVTGEMGIGKTTLVNAFLERVSARVPGLWIARGQCAEHYGAGEAFMPVLEALGRLCRQPDGARLVKLLRRHAPIWLEQMGRSGRAGRQALQRERGAMTRERMLRVMAEAVEVLTAKVPLILVLEDLQWCDHSTVTLIAALAQRQEPARLMLIVTYRPADVRLNRHPLELVAQQLQLHRQCAELPLPSLSATAAALYLTARFRGHQLPEDLAGMIHRRTDGNPLFMVSLVDHLVGQGWLTPSAHQWAPQVGPDLLKDAVPTSLRTMIETQVERLDTGEQRVLEAASVVGMDFAAQAVAAALNQAVERVEASCVNLVRGHQFLTVQGTSRAPGLALAARYRFVHALYRSTLYERITPACRQTFHRRIGAQLEASAGARSSDMAAELAVHFDRGGDRVRALAYYGHAADTALRRRAYRVAVDHFRRALELLNGLPDAGARAQHALAVQIALDLALISAEGHDAPEVEEACARALTLSQRLEEAPALFVHLARLYSVNMIKGELATARTLAERVVSLAERLQFPVFRVAAHTMMGVVLYEQGEFVPARAHLENGMALYDPQLPELLVDSKVTLMGYLGVTLTTLGCPDQGLRMSDGAIVRARARGDPHNLTLGLHLAAQVHQLRQECRAAQELAEAANALSQEQGHPLFLAMGSTVLGWALAEQGCVTEGIAQLRARLAAEQGVGRVTSLGLLGRAYVVNGQVTEALVVLDEALTRVRETGGRRFEAELYRIKGEALALVSSLERNCAGKRAEAEACLRQAVDIARQQGAKWFELRAATSLARLQRHGKRAEATCLLAELCDGFTEGIETADVKSARALLGALET